MKKTWASWSICRTARQAMTVSRDWFRLLDPTEMAQAFQAFACALREGLGLAPPKGVVAIDGKSLRRGYERGRACMPPLMVSVWDAETRVSIAARASADGNEVAATLAAYVLLDLKGCVVTADALHCHPKMAQGVRATGAHYALKLKGNNGPLHACAVRAFALADASGILTFHETSETGHDRFERRRGLHCRPARKRAAFSRAGPVRSDRKRAPDRQGRACALHPLCRAVQAHVAETADGDGEDALGRRKQPPLAARRRIATHNVRDQGYEQSCAAAIMPRVEVARISNITRANRKKRIHQWPSIHGTRSHGNRQLTPRRSYPYLICDSPA